MHISFKGIIVLDTPAMMAWTFRKEDKVEWREHDNKSGV